jgi:hypothetical protein
LAGTVLVFAALFIPIVSSCSLTSYDTLPFTDGRLGSAPRPYFFPSEEDLGYFVSTYYIGSFSTDSLFSYFFRDRVNLTESQVSEDSFLDFQAGNTAWLVRMDELMDRGLEFQVWHVSYSTPHYLSMTEFDSLYSSLALNRVADTGSSLFFVS